MRRIMILGAGRGQVGLIKAAKKLGYETVVVSPMGSYPGLEIADIIVDLDIRDEEAVLSAADEYSIEGAATACLDLGLKSLGNLCEKKKLRGIDRRAATLSVNKLEMKEAFISGGANTAKYVKVSSEDDLEAAVQRLTMPLIVKAVDLAGSKGIYTVNDKNELRECFQKTMSVTRQDYCIVEEFIEGYKFGATAFVVDGEVLFILPCADVTVERGTVVPVGHYVPLDLEKDALDEVNAQVTRGIRAMGLDNCAVNADLILRDGQVFIVELTGRLGSNCLPELTSIYYGSDINEMIAKTAMGDFDPARDFNANSAKTPCYGQMIISEKSGTLKNITDKNPESDSIADVTFFVKEGSRINSFRNTSDCLGQIVVKAEDVDHCREEMRLAMANIEIELEQ